jgi:hypothetical protein
MFDFPNNPVVNQSVTAPNGGFFIWDGSKWTNGAGPSPTLYLPLAGGTMGGPLTLSGNATQPMHAVPLQQLTAVTGGPFLPLVGGTVARHMTSSATDSNLLINATAVGSGVNGPATCQTGLALKLYKDNWASSPSTAAVGEIDGLVIECRQGGAGSDCSGILIGIQNLGAGYLSAVESNASVINPSNGRYTYFLATTTAGINPATSEATGLVCTANAGTCSDGVLVQSAQFSGYSATWTYFFRGVQNGVQMITIDGSGNINTSGSVNSPAIHGTNLYLRSDTAVGINYNASGNIQFSIGGNSAEIYPSGGLAIQGAKVIGYPIAGWGTSTGGVRGAITAASTLPQVAAAVAQLLTDLKTHGMIGA